MNRSAQHYDNNHATKMAGSIMPNGSTSAAECGVFAGGVVFATIVADDPAMKWINAHWVTVITCALGGAWIAFLALLFVPGKSSRDSLAKILASATLCAMIGALAMSGEGLTAKWVVGIMLGGGLIAAAALKSAVEFINELQSSGEFKRAIASALSWMWDWAIPKAIHKPQYPAISPATEAPDGSRIESKSTQLRPLGDDKIDGAHDRTHDGDNRKT